ncbi:hypothetical protein GJV26_16980 [Massilia dura]|uniref:TubC N-terminal docking domain-containing protein n=1 Tax=Pseudoduganella dura TaxID=321982 RepID=A0A6I3XNE2_9BURK|nr:hypothetical protein [Pseudoduganella dura]MUI14138.1 hypothetical protein [Pseudoduganella dura]GGX76845.1 hypothetical protein GCM10007386_05050 [Pseudoduganella dura]
MSVETVIEQCRADGLAISADGGQLVVTGAPQTVDTWRPVLKDHKNELLAYLASDRAQLFAARVMVFQQHGLPQHAAEPIARRLAIRDAQQHERRICLECANLYGSVKAWRCGNRSKATIAGPALPADLVDLLHRCRGFSLSPHLT